MKNEKNEISFINFTEVTVEEECFPKKRYRFKENRTEYRKTGQFDPMYGEITEIVGQKIEYYELTLREQAIVNYFAEILKELRRDIEKDLDRKKDK